jgi:hypothetical protein
MIKLFLSLVFSALVLMSLCANSQELVENEDTSEAVVNEVIEVAKEAAIVETDQSLWNQTNANPTIETLSVYLAKFPNGEFSKHVMPMLQVLEDKAQAREKKNKQLEAYRKRQIVGGIVLELDGKFNDIKPYIRSMINSCGYTLVKPHRFAKRVYPTLVIGGQMYNGAYPSEHAVTLDLALVLKSTSREIQARQKMRSYRTSKVDTHQALIAAFEDIGAQMKSAGFCIVD